MVIFHCPIGPYEVKRDGKVVNHKCPNCRAYIGNLQKSKARRVCKNCGAGIIHDADEIKCVVK